MCVAAAAALLSVDNGASTLVCLQAGKVHAGGRSCSCSRQAAAAALDCAPRSSCIGHSSGAPGVRVHPARRWCVMTDQAGSQQAGHAELEMFPPPRWRLTKRTDYEQACTTCACRTRHASKQASTSQQASKGKRARKASKHAQQASKRQQASKQASDSKQARQAHASMRTTMFLPRPVHVHGLPREASPCTQGASDSTLPRGEVGRASPGIRPISTTAAPGGAEMRPPGAPDPPI